jgi:hypothetical protein
MIEYYVLTGDPCFPQIINFIRQHQLATDIHLNRTRFTVDPTSHAHTELLLRFASAVHPV